MSKTTRLAVLFIVALAAIAVILWGRARDRAGDTAVPMSSEEPSVPASAAAPAEVARPEGPLPRLIDLGSKTCIPCKKMAPILEELEREYEGRMTVLFIDVNENRQAAADYGIRLIPTQVFFDSGGRELFRHEGFFGKEAILDKWRELGVDLDRPGESPGRSAG